MRGRRIGPAFAAALALVAADGWAARGGSRSGGKSAAGFAGAGAPGVRAGATPRFSRPVPMTGSPRPWRHYGRTVIFIGGPFWFWSWPYGYYYMPPPYYYGPDYMPRQHWPPVYVEKFDGTPTPQTQGEIFCPSQNAYYPDVQDCPNGWQRIIREEPAADATAETAG